ncbi:dTDP-glucose 4,6-dehydratase [Paenibacillus faecalis]|uniref:dTDP-glucose 4,6-dehydratase n=1 Tax=Paenibacillus faecalis TaxID=2079532 RepID=UPI000D0E3CD3|nr:dTDP-glucose 4,6-dehydratase [Paenibacillus faecalis]
MKLLVTGGAGFIGSNFVLYMLRKHPDYHIMNMDALTYAGNLENLKSVEDDPNYSFIKGDIAHKETVDSIFQQGVDAVVNFAAESHVDRSILEPEVFVNTNVLGTQVLLDAAKKYGVSRFVQVSTDEVYGSLGDSGLFTETTPLAPNSPYSASKAGADLLVRAYHETFGLPVNVTRCSNNYGPYQFPEKLIPLMIARALNDEPLPVYGDGLNVRDWLYVEDHCRAIDLVLHQGRDGEVYNIGGNNERTNIDIVKTILKQLGKPESLITYVEDRLGHDRRYGIDPTKMVKELGWKPEHNFESGIQKTIQWYLDNKDWWTRIQSGAYRDYVTRQYGERLGGPQ